MQVTLMIKYLSSLNKTGGYDQINETRLFEDIFTCNPGLTHVNLSTTRITDSNLQTLGTTYYFFVKLQN
jgi:hypothetical protein